MLIIDEISLVGKKNLYKIHKRCVQLLYAVFSSREFLNEYTKEILQNIWTLPFGGLHVLFGGKLLLI
jgi:hypothetical protein